MKKDVLILCAGYPYQTDTGIGYHVAEILREMSLPNNVEVLEVGESGCMIPSFVEGRRKLIVVDFFKTKNSPGTVVKLKTEEVPIRVDGIIDMPKYHFIDMLNQIKVSGQCPETVFLGMVPKDTETISYELTPEIKEKLPELINLILKEIVQ